MRLTNPKIVGSDQMLAVEKHSAVLGVSTDQLMENAGLNVAAAIKNHVGRIAGLIVLILVGPGYNGSDGLVVARHLKRWGADATVYLTS